MVKNIQKIHQNQKGLVAIIVSIVVILLISLITLSFSRIVNREQRQALDRQLSTQAFYAAEAGINEARFQISDIVRKGDNVPDKKDCNPVVPQDKSDPSNPLGGFDFTTSSQLDDELGIEFTCLLVDVAPPTLEFGSINPNKSQVFPVEADTALEFIKVGWNAKDGSTDLNCPTPGQLPPASSWPCATGIVRVDLVPVPNQVTRPGLINNNFTVFLYPCAPPPAGAGGCGSGDVDYVIGPANQGQIIAPTCDSSDANPEDKYCTVTIKQLTAKRYFMRLRSYYADVSVQIKGFNGATQLELKHAQALIDSTGKANDVLRRLQVRVPIHKQFGLPDYALEALDSLCKRLKVAPGMSALIDDPTGSTGACQID